MHKLIKIICYIILNASFAYSQNGTANTLTVSVSNLDSSDGKVFITLYNSSDSFLKKGFKTSYATITEKSCQVVFKDVPNGTYAISLFHDENGNNKMDTGFFGIPKESYGCSNNAKGVMGPPKWEDAKFQIQDQSISQHIQL